MTWSICSLLGKWGKNLDDLQIISAYAGIQSGKRTSLGF